MSSAPDPPRIAAATPADVPLILALIRELADYERMSDHVVATEADVERALFGERPCAEAVIARVGDEAVGFALFFQSFSTFVGRPGLYLEDLYVRPGAPRARHRAGPARASGPPRGRAGVRPVRMVGARLERVGDLLVPAAGAVPMDEWTVYRLTGEPLRALAAEAAAP